MENNNGNQPNSGQNSNTTDPQNNYQPNWTQNTNPANPQVNYQSNNNQQNNGGYQPSYQPQYQQSVDNALDAPLKLSDYLIMMLIQMVPIVNIVMLFVWAFGDSNTNKKNYARAMLIIALIGIVLAFLFGAVIFASFASMMRSGY